MVVRSTKGNVSKLEHHASVYHAHMKDQNVITPEKNFISVISVVAAPQTFQYCLRNSRFGFFSKLDNEREMGVRSAFTILLRWPKGNDC